MVLKMLDDYKIKTITGAKITEFFEDGVCYEKDGQKFELHDMNNVINAMGVRSYNPLEAEIKGLVPEVYVIGDAAQTRNVFYATRDAIYTANKI